VQKLVSLVLLLVGAAGTWFVLLRPVIGVVRSREWTASECLIVESGLTRNVSSDHGRPASQQAVTQAVTVRYRYEVDGKEHESNRYSFLDGIATSDSARKRRIVAKYPVGRTVTCYVDPRDPSSAVLNRSFTADMLLGLIPLAMLAAGVLTVGIIPTGVFAPLARSKPPIAPAPGAPAAPLASHRASADVRWGFQAALLLTGMAVWNVIASIGDEVSDMGALAVNALVLGALTLGYRRGILACALGLLAYPAVVLVSVLVFWFWPQAPATLSAWLVRAVPEPRLIPSFLDGPERLQRYASEVASFSILLIPIAILLGRGIRQMVRRQETSPVPALAGVGVPTAVLLALIVGSGIASQLDLRPRVAGQARMTAQEIESTLGGADESAWPRACEQAQGQGHLPVSMVKGLVRAATTGEVATRGACLAAMEKLGANGGDAIPALRNALADPSPYLRLVAVQSLAAVGARAQQPAVMADVVAAASDPDPQVRRFAIGALAQFGAAGEGAMPALRTALSDSAADVRENAARVLKSLGPVAAPAVVDLAKALGDGEPGVRQRASEALAAIGPAAREAVPALTKATHDSSDAVRSAAVDALARVQTR
jgi:hypothetical protein